MLVSRIIPLQGSSCLKGALHKRKYNKDRVECFKFRHPAQTSDIYVPS